MKWYSKATPHVHPTKGRQPPLNGPPLAGQHNREVLEQMGYTPSEIDQLHAKGVLFQEVP